MSTRTPYMVARMWADSWAQLDHADAVAFAHWYDEESKSDPDIGNLNISQLYSHWKIHERQAL